MKLLYGISSVLHPIHVLNLVKFSSPLVKSKLWAVQSLHCTPARAMLRCVYVGGTVMMRTPVSCAGSSRSSSVQPVAMLYAVGLKICAFTAAQRHAVHRAAARAFFFSPSAAVLLVFRSAHFWSETNVRARLSPQEKERVCHLESSRVKSLWGGFHLELETSQESLI